MAEQEPEHVLHDRLQSCPPTGWRWQHHKGAFYVIVGNAIIEKTLEPAVLYRRVDGEVTWVRSLSDWNQLVPVGESQVPRFAPMTATTSSATRITIIPFIHGKLSRRGKLNEPDIDWILEKWLQRHPDLNKRERDIRVVRGTRTLPPGIKTDTITASIVAGDDIVGYDPTQDQDLYAYYLADDPP